MWKNVLIKFGANFIYVCNFRIEKKALLGTSLYIACFMV